MTLCFLIPDLSFTVISTGRSERRNLPVAVPRAHAPRFGTGGAPCRFLHSMVLRTIPVEMTGGGRADTERRIMTFPDTS